MPTSRDEQFRTETPFLPQPLAGDVLATVVQPCTTLQEAEQQVVQLSAFRQQISAAADTVELAISQNHADYLGGRHCWSYETTLEVRQRLRILKRQRQHLQEAFGACNRRIKELQHQQRQQAVMEKPPEVVRALRFVQMAQVLLAPETVALLWDLVDNQALSNGVGRSNDEVTTP